MRYNPIFFQLHPEQDIKNALTEIHNACNCPIIITEFDLSFDNRSSTNPNGSFIDPHLPFEAENHTYRNWFEYQAFAYKKMIKICKETDYVSELYFWMLADEPQITWERKGCGILNSDFEIKSEFTNLFRNK